MKKYIASLLAFTLLLGPAGISADSTFGYQDSSPVDGYSIGIGPYEGGVDAAQRFVATGSGYLSELNFKGYKTGSPSWKPVVMIWSSQAVVSGECAGFGQLVTNFASSSDCPAVVIATSSEATITTTSTSGENVTVTFSPAVYIEQGHVYFIDVRSPYDSQAANNNYGTNHYAMLYAPNVTAGGVKSWKRGSGNGSTAWRWWPDAHGALHIYGTVVSAPPPSVPSVTLAASSTSITQGQSTNLTWIGANVSSCTGTNFTSATTTGQVSVSPSATTTYSILCTGANGAASATTTIGVYVPPPPPTPQDLELAEEEYDSPTQHVAKFRDPNNGVVCYAWYLKTASSTTGFACIKI